MNSNSTHNKHARSGLTLIETLMYIGLLSCILTIVLPYAASVNEKSLRLLNDIDTAYAT